MNVDPAHVNRKVGFTGTRDGLTAPQEAALRKLLAALAPAQFHHGDCVGADGAAAAIADSLSPRPRIICHPPDVAGLRAHTSFNDEVLPCDHYLSRNSRIVRYTGVLVACPKLTHKRQRTGGTWDTIAKAERRNRPVYAVWPDGTISTPEEGLPQ